MVESDEQSERDSGGGAAMAALHQCELIQNMIEISISSLQGLRTKCAASNDLTQQEIRTLEVIITQRMLKNSRPNCSVMQAFATVMGCRLSLSLSLVALRVSPHPSLPIFAVYSCVGCAPRCGGLQRTDNNVCKCGFIYIDHSGQPSY